MAGLLITEKGTGEQATLEGSGDIFPSIPMTEFMEGWRFSPLTKRDA